MTPAAAKTQATVDPAAVMKIRSLELRAKAVVEGLWRGLHRSPFHGFSVEFTEHRLYTPGDDVRFLDWRLYARTDRDYIKKFEDETNLRCHLVVDQSRSMAYGSVGYSKADYAATLAATLAYFLAAQGDAIGLLTFADAIGEHLPARNRPGHLRRLLLALEHPAEGRGTAARRALDRAAELLHRRGLVVIVSDLLTPLDEWERPLATLRAGRHEVMLFQVLDPAERALRFDGPAVLRDMESGRALYVDPEAARAGYQQSLEAHLARIAAVCARLGVERRLVTTDTPWGDVLLDLLSSRGRRRGR